MKSKRENSRLTHREEQLWGLESRVPRQPAVNKPALKQAHKAITLGRKREDSGRTLDSVQLRRGEARRASVKGLAEVKVKKILEATKILSRAKEKKKKKKKRKKRTKGGGDGLLGQMNERRRMRQGTAETASARRRANGVDEEEVEEEEGGRRRRGGGGEEKEISGGVALLFFCLRAGGSAWGRPLFFLLLDHQTGARTLGRTTTRYGYYYCCCCCCCCCYSLPFRSSKARAGGVDSGQVARSGGEGSVPVGRQRVRDNPPPLVGRRLCAGRRGEGDGKDPRPVLVIGRRVEGGPVSYRNSRVVTGAETASQQARPA
ncbi:hypothetical protein TRV_03445 [Trichophyton verrucosum HKI 0517]|uniref:Uncharacterized protein n=1 Tax=Trichophyton verrucosum (strain HKI 0517) TaxID=663202 RepID=D4D8K8_TRIVH|nr:uncharacterized protein TRV_03445 [Trichophyton verrucosum HKI 0517]EFE41763.1 hypothetical protein TRV_03445 [Trichophyton verrucosum HKI 0517]